MTRYPNSIPPNPRTLSEAFGPHTDSTLHPMPEPARQHPAELVVLGIGVGLVLLLLAEWCGWL